MKKLLVYILLSLLITIAMIGTTVLATNEDTPLSDTRTLLAAEENPFKVPIIPKPGLLPGPTEETQAEKGGARNILIDTILPFFGIGFVGIVGAFSLLFLVIAGVRFTTAYGNEEAVQNAKNQAVYALVGLMVALLSYTIVRIVTNIQIFK
jgi:hypothetical protein